MNYQLQRNINTLLKNDNFLLKFEVINDQKIKILVLIEFVVIIVRLQDLYNQNILKVRLNVNLISTEVIHPVHLNFLNLTLKKLWHKFCLTLCYAIKI